MDRPPLPSCLNMQKTPVLANGQGEVCAIVQAALDAKAEKAMLYDVRAHSSITDYVVVCNGRSPAHVRGIGERIEREMKAQGAHCFSAEGLSEGSWVLLDYQDTLVHVFHPDTRAYYDLDALLQGSPCERVDVPKKGDVSEESESEDRA